jgi:LacI family transcriptional regulator
MKRFSKITTTQLARICGVSQGTVDRALHNRGDVNAQTRERILAVAKEYDYTPKLENGTQENSMLIGVVLFDLYNEFFSKLAMSLVREAKRAGYSVIFQFSNKDKQSEKEALEYFDYIGVDGIVLFSAGSDSDEYKNYLSSIKRPIVLIGNKLFDFPFVGINDEKAMYELSLKITNESKAGDVLYFAPVLNKQLHSQNAQRKRLNGFLKAMKETDKSYRIVTSAQELSDCGGIICATDYYVLRALKHLGYPKDLPIGGFDNISVLKSISVKVLSVEYSTDKIAEESINYILGRDYKSEIEHSLIYNTD